MLVKMFKIHRILINAVCLSIITPAGTLKNTCLRFRGVVTACLGPPLSSFTNCW